MMKPFNPLTMQQQNRNPILNTRPRRGAPHAAALPLSAPQNLLIQALSGATDALEISQLAKELSATESEVCPHAQRFEERMAEIAEASRKMQSAREAADGAAEAWRIKAKTLEIARRIIRGDNVPPADYSFLAEHNPELFKEAVTLRNISENDDPEDHDALSERDENKLANDINDLKGKEVPSFAPSMPSAPSAPSQSPSGDSAPSPSPQ